MATTCLEEEGEGNTSRWEVGDSVDGEIDVTKRLETMDEARGRKRDGKVSNDAELQAEIREQIRSRMRGCQGIAKRCLEQAKRKCPKNNQKAERNYPLQRGKVTSSMRAFQCTTGNNPRLCNNMKPPGGKRGNNNRDISNLSRSPRYPSPCQTPHAQKNRTSTTGRFAATNEHKQQREDIQREPLQDREPYKYYFHQLFRTLLQGTNAAKHGLLDYGDKDTCIRAIQRVDVEAESPIQVKSKQTTTPRTMETYCRNEGSLLHSAGQQEYQSCDSGDLGLSFSGSLKHSTTSQLDLTLATTTSSENLHFLGTDTIGSPTFSKHFLD